VGLTAPRRSDAQRNIERILEAAIECLSADPNASASAIAKAAGVGRVTLYAHFATREALVEAALIRVLAEGDAVLAEVDLTGEPTEALRALIESSWLQIARSGALVVAAQSALAPDRVQALHGAHERRVDGLIRRGQREGAFRDDLPASWLSSLLHYVLHGAGQDVATGRLDGASAARYISESLLAAFRRREQPSADKGAT
jgi:TetR/AcrR family transcriptional repressor of mexCD-oprJ operon